MTDPRIKDDRIRTAVAAIQVDEAKMPNHEKAEPTVEERDWVDKELDDPEFRKKFLAEISRQHEHAIRAAVAAESKLWHETCQGKREMMSDDRVAAVSDAVAAERERCAGLVPTNVECPDCGAKVDRACMVSIWNAGQHQAMPNKVSIHPHVKRWRAAIRAEPESTEDE